MSEGWPHRRVADPEGREADHGLTIVGLIAVW
jgi:hypothetical protein